ncbi:hypothetical protein [Bifidobacterium vespertilionis]|uniref:Uncharacterized protein n=1 Tax=Bifidobacterium vespertilionis TaxID=2562524 RepID=A0A5J5DWI1_9BIFI|nr:hypothetical protein [Bifidobacterium vespertilionis]KAA8815730.1 hypothetical protein EMO90_11860 [Bifidobacterium vespertilionis]KAA8821032.1 hypothetical protein EM848_11620 [Bifidobacterium vespertilionis]
MENVEQWNWTYEELTRRFGEPVSPMGFYRDLFPVGSFERKGHSEDRLPNAIVMEVFSGSRRNGNGERKPDVRRTSCPTVWMS